ncbi:MAG TPA: glycosyltransferase, partial [Gammaproteobacteria bacterium]|nr:glycosyltransferase [Gammaproteobacteria bacterium]
IRSKAGRSKAGNVVLLGYQPNHVLLDHLQRAKAFIFAAEEDFGLLPLEAQACGTPVIAYGKGGALETVRGLDEKNPTGVFFAKQTTTAIVDAIKQFEQVQNQLTVDNCTMNAARFAPERFRKEFMAFVNGKV